MNDFTCDFRNLDADARGYLESVARDKGRGAPGIYVARRGAGCLGFFNLFLGIFIILVGWGFAAGSHKEPWAVALLFTAATMLGGWLMVYPIRKLLGGGLGHFSYFDPQHVYEVTGREVRVTDIDGWTTLTPEEVVTNSSYQRTKLHFSLPGRRFTTEVANRKGGELVTDYYSNLHSLTQDANWTTQPAAERGATAKYMALEGEFPADSKLLDLTINEVPAEASTSKTTKSGMRMRYLIILGLGAIVYFGSWQFIKPMQDEMAFQDAEHHGVQGYRDYLLDPRNTRHRDAAKTKIKDLYQQAITQAASAPDAIERKGWMDLLTNLSETEGLPVVSLAVTEEGDARSADREKQTRTWLADSLGSKFGPDHIVFVEAPPEAKPLVELKLRPNSAEGKTEWQLLFRATPTAEPITGPWHTATEASRGIATSYPSDAFKAAFFMEAFRVAPPAIHTAPTGGGDFE